jgi:hypothetical protein
MNFETLQPYVCSLVFTPFRTAWKTATQNLNFSIKSAILYPLQAIYL